MLIKLFLVPLTALSVQVQWVWSQPF